MRLDANCLKLLGCGFDASGIVATVEVSVDRQGGSSCGGANEVKDLLGTVERFASPVLKISEMGFHFGSARGVVGNGEG